MTGTWLAVILVMALASTACDPFAGVTQAIDDAIRAMSQESRSWRDELEKLQERIAHDAQTTIKNEVQNTLVRATAAAGSNFRCTIDFIRDRVIEDLRQIRAMVTGEKASPRQPRICQVVPDAIDMSFEPSRRNLITYDGYNFDQAEIKVALQERRGDKDVNLVDVTSQLAKQTHYRMTLNLSENGVQLSPLSQSIVLNFAGGNSTIQVLQPTPEPCRTEATVPEFAHDYMPLWDRSTGDREFFGKVEITVRTWVAVEGRRLILRIYMKAEQPGDDHTRAEGTDRFDVSYDAPAGWRLDSIASQKLDQLPTFLDTDTDPNDFKRGDGLVKSYRIIGDTVGEDAGTKTKVTAEINPITVRIVREGCAS
jgi:hypothetical protein